MKTAVLGATGYTGMLLCRLLSGHPEVSLLLPVSSSRAGQSLSQVDPGFADGGGKLGPEERLLTLEEAALQGPEVVFSALPHLESARLLEPFLGKAVVIDLSADFRIQDPALFAAAYGGPPPRPELLPQAVYGLAEWHRRRIGDSQLIANPGCYPTATLLPVLPLLASGLIEPRLQVSAISGISGAGRKLKSEYLFCKRSENAGAYAPGRTHRHVAEMEEQLRLLDAQATVLFVPHLAPLRKGMAVTTFARLRDGASEERVGEALRQAYAGCPFVRLRAAVLPQTSDVRGTNRCDIAWRREGDTLMLFSVLDNLVKGASGQAVQNMNLRLRLPETAGLPLDSEV